MQVQRLWTNASIATMAGPGTGREALGIVEEPALVAERDGRIIWVGPVREFPREIEWVGPDLIDYDPQDLVLELDDPRSVSSHPGVVDCTGLWITPGLIDCHTHAVFAGDRSDEFERRLAGESYADIARSGGGIAATVRATRAAREGELVDLAWPRLQALAADGVTTVEIKSGYGLDLITEMRQLRAARVLGSYRGGEYAINVVTTYLGAHAVPGDVARSEYVRRVCEQVIPRVAAEGLADAVDAFHETIAFTTEEVAVVFEAAKAAGLPVKLHADQLADNGGAMLAARFGALSADHLEYANELGVAAMGRAGTVAVILPGAYYVLREKQKPPVELFRRYGVPMAVATDLNPGTSPVLSIRTAAHMACTFFGLTVPEALLGMTRHAAQALGRLSEIGTIEPGKRCDLAIWKVDSLSEIVARIGPAPLGRRVVNGA